MSFEISRRAFLIQSATLTTVALAAGGLDARPSHLFPLDIDPNQIRESDLFSLGVASGDVTTNSVILWTFYEGSLPLHLCIWENNPGNKKLILSSDVKAGDGGFSHIDITGLASSQRYQYGFFELNSKGSPQARSGLGTFKTAPGLNDLAPVTFGASCCTFNLFQPRILEHAGARTDLDAFLLLGDTTYNDGCETLEDFRYRWANNLSKKGYLDLRAGTSVIATLDDHEITNNFDPEKTPPATVAAAKRAFFNNLPIRRNQENPNQIWRKMRFGKTVELFVLDCRTERRPSTRQKPNAQYLSREQMDWLKKGLLESEAVFKVIMNSVPIMDFNLPELPDRWAGYPAQRLEILNHIDRAEIPGVLWVSGDLHFASFGRVAKEGPGKNALEVLVGPGAQIPSITGIPLKFSSQFEWVSLRNNYVTLSFDPHRADVGLIFQAGSEDPKNPFVDIEPVFAKTLSLGKF